MGLPGRLKVKLLTSPWALCEGCTHCPAAVLRLMLPILETSGREAGTSQTVRPWGGDSLPHEVALPVTQQCRPRLCCAWGRTASLGHNTCLPSSSPSHEMFLQTRPLSTSRALDPCLRLCFHGPGHETGGNPGVPLLKIAQ